MLTGASAAGRLALKPGLLPVWCNDDALQIGIDPRRAVAVCGVGRAAALVSLFDGSRDYEAVIAAARAHGITAEAADRLITLLATAGVLDDFPAGLLRTVPDGVRSRIAPELATSATSGARCPECSRAKAHFGHRMPANIGKQP